MNKIHHIALLATLLFFVWACKPDTECRTEEAVRCRVVFECDSVVTTADTTYTTTFTTIDSLTVKGVGQDSVLYDNQKSISSISLPLRKDTSETRFDITFNGQNDVLVIRHSNHDYFVSLACGCFVYHDIDTVYTEGGLVKYALILNTAVENVEQDNVQLKISF